MFFPNPAVMQCSWLCVNKEDDDFIRCYSAQHQCDIWIHKHNLEECVIVGVVDAPYLSSREREWVAVKRNDESNVIPFHVPAEVFEISYGSFYNCDALTINDHFIYYITDKWDYAEMGKRQDIESNVVYLYTDHVGTSHDSGSTQVIPPEEFELVKKHLTDAGFNVIVSEYDHE